MPKTLASMTKLGLIAGSIWLLLTAFSVSPDPRGVGTHEQLGLSPCQYLATTGTPCISCGMTTSFAHTVRLQIPSALKANPAGTMLCLLIMTIPGFLLHSLVTGSPATRVLLHPWARWALPLAIVILLGSWWYKVRVTT